ncbi:MAG: hypothetical protein ACO20G_00620 [Ilumatobacteraceae bacterium]
MRLLFTRARDDRRIGADDNLGRGMEAAIMLGLFLGLGWLIDSWLGTRPGFMIGLTIFAAVGVFVRMKYAYEATITALEAERKNAARASQRSDSEAAV